MLLQIKDWLDIPIFYLLQITEQVLYIFVQSLRGISKRIEQFYLFIYLFFFW